MKAQTIPDSALDELLDNNVPCHDCGNPATLRSFGHGRCPDIDGEFPPYFKCITCWKVWYAKTQRIVAKWGHVRHVTCGMEFTTVEELSDYREF